MKKGLSVTLVVVAAIIGMTSIHKAMKKRKLEER